MTRSKRTVSLVCCLAVLLVGSILHTSAAQKALPRAQNSLAMAEEQLKQILPLMTTDPRGRLSRGEYMHFMEAEFDRLDKDKKGELDVRALAQSINGPVNRFAGK